MKSFLHHSQPPKSSELPFRRCLCLAGLKHQPQARPPQQYTLKDDLKSILEKGNKSQEQNKGSDPKVTGSASQRGAGQPTGTDLLTFERKGCLLTRQLLTTEAVLELAKVVQSEVDRRKLEALQHRLRVLSTDKQERTAKSIEHAKQLLSSLTSEKVGFLQTFNSWRTCTTVSEIANRLAPYAAGLLGCKRVRLYQDCAFLKEPGFDATNWHSDLRMAPFDTNSFVTAWVPLRRIKAKGDSGLTFAVGSHRDFALPFWHGDGLEDMDLSSRGYKLQNTGQMNLGDVSWHHGWTLHYSPPQPLASQPRLAIAFSYFKDGTKVLSQQAMASKMRLEDQESFSDWLEDVRAGSNAAHRLLPLMN